MSETATKRPAARRLAGAAMELEDAATNARDAAQHLKHGDRLRGAEALDQALAWLTSASTHLYAVQAELDEEQPTP